MNVPRRRRPRCLAWPARLAAGCALCLAGLSAAVAYPAALASAQSVPHADVVARDADPYADEWTEAARVAVYLRLHQATDHSVIPLYPLAAYAAATRGPQGDAKRTAPRRTAAARAVRMQ